VDLHPLKWLPILYLFVLSRRPARSAALYRRIWQAEGSPLLIHSRTQAHGLQERLGSRYRVALGMRYGEPGIGPAMAELRRGGCDRVLVFPLFPQFSCSTTGSIYDAVNQAAVGRRCPLFFDRRREMPALRFVPPYYDDPGYIRALAISVREDWTRAGIQPDHCLFSFHGLPQRYADEGDPYPGQCAVTAGLLATSLGLSPRTWSLTYQSRFGREPWLQPYTDQTIEHLASAGLRTLAICCPGFTADCLETLDEIGHEGKRRFLTAGGINLHLSPCLNGQPTWLDAMADLTRRETAGWT
jgi:ferrochelatase